MTAYYDRPASYSAAWARRVGVFALVLFCVDVLAHRFGSLAIGHFVVIAGLAAVLSAVALLLSVVGFVRLWMVGAKGGLASAVALICAVVVLTPVAYDSWLFAALPELYDVTSDVSDPPQWLSSVPTGPWLIASPSENADDQRTIEAVIYPDLVGRRYEGGFDKVMKAVRLAMIDTRLSVVSETGADGSKPGKFAPAISPDEASGTVAEKPAPSIPVPVDRPSPIVPQAEPAAPRVARIQAVHRSRIVGLTSDVLIRLREDGNYTDVDLRVRARFGPHDLGTGAALIDSFFKDLDSDLVGLGDG